MTGKQEFERWLASPLLTMKEKEELSLIQTDEAEILERFFSPLEFGTAGLRGIMGTGIRRMNARVIRQATRALGELILEAGAEACARGVVLCYDCRLNSRNFAEEAARVLASMGIFVRMFPELRPTPELSFSIRYFHAVSGINITASHNPKEYNGYKVYWEDGAQLPPQQASLVAGKMERIDVLYPEPELSFEACVAQGKIMFLDREIDEAFLKQVIEQSLLNNIAEKSGLTVVYTPFYGAGAKLVPELLQRVGLRSLFCVAEQMEPDGTFPTAKNPNPEFEIGFERALLLAKEKDADLIIGTDPDSDRLGVMTKVKSGEYRLLSGNQAGVLFVDYLLSQRKEQGTMPNRPVILKSIVSSEMTRAASAYYGVPLKDTFTGFKYLAEQMKYSEEAGETVLFSYEEAIGYAFSTFVRDKDAVTAALLMVELAAYHKLQGLSLWEKLQRLYERLGWYQEQTISLVMPGIDGIEKMQRLMQLLRDETPDTLGGIPVLAVRDYLSGKRTEDGAEETMLLSGSNVLYFELGEGSFFAVRPSGTEPKIKVYISVKDQCKEAAEEKLQKLTAAAKKLAEAVS